MKIVVCGSILLDIHANTSGNLMTSSQAGEVSITLGGAAFNTFCNIIAIGSEKAKFFCYLKNNSFLSKMIVSKLRDMRVYDRVFIDFTDGINEAIYISIVNGEGIKTAITSNYMEVINNETLIKEIMKSCCNAQYLITDLSFSERDVKSLLKWGKENNKENISILTSKENTKKLLYCKEYFPSVVVGRHAEMVILSDYINIANGTCFYLLSDNGGWKALQDKKTLFTMSDIVTDSVPKKTMGCSSLIAALHVIKKEKNLIWRDIAELYLRYYELLQKCPGANLLTQEISEVLNYSFFRDSLTGAYTREVLNDIVKNLHLLKASKVLGMLILDIDHFKKINDTYGHKTGDSVLVKVADVIRSVMRNDDLLFRLGGEEFLCLIMDVDETLLKEIAERIRNKVMEIPFEQKITISIGGTVYNKDSFNFEQAYKETDVKLYQAKSSGRNCTII